MSDRSRESLRAGRLPAGGSGGDFGWEVPRLFNIGIAVADRWAATEPDRVALLADRPGGEPARLTFGRLARDSNRLANALRQRGIARGDRVAVLLSQGFETAVAHVACYKLGAVVVPLALLFGIEALEFRLQTAGAGAVIATGAGWRKLQPIAGRLGALRCVVTVDERLPGAEFLPALLQEGGEACEAVETAADDPAMMIFTSGTTGPPKGALLPHRVLLGHLPGFAMAYEGPPRPGDLMWTPADWAWAGGLLNALLPSLYHGIPVVAAPAEKFEPQHALDLMARLRVSLAFIPPTALRMLRAGPAIAREKLALRAVCSAGEALGRDTFEWARAALGVTPNEMYGQTECNFVIGSSAALGVSRPGFTGKPVPGHQVAIIDAAGLPCPAGQAGEIAVRRPDPVMFLGYWQNDEATRQKFIGDWMTTGDQGVADEEGFIRFVGRNDDVITSSGFRIGPGEVEDCLAGHPAVALSAVVGKPDPLRTEIVKAYVVLKDAAAASPELAAEIGRFVRERLSAHEYPREVEFVRSIPLTTSGKVIRRIFRARARREASL